MDKIIERLGLLKPHKCETELTYPDDITSLSDVELGSFYWKLSALLQYTNYLAAKTEVDAMIAREKYEKIKNMYLLEDSWDKKLTITERKLIVEMKADVEEARKNYLNKEALSKIIHSLLASYQEAVKAASREMARRQYVLEKRGLGEG